MNNNSTDNDNRKSCVETPAAPDWLSKLEHRREKSAKAKLGHEAGAGAACNECGDKCPGLDLHFWRKLCRNCKCRKDQHMCTDDDSFGWAQFEILGQIRSKPAFIKIKALANEPIQLEWVPPNIAPDLVSDYMEKLGVTKIPVAGSDAANKRKQQLEFQVPPHDLDATLCDNLSEFETNQLQQYVQKIRENCVGQGVVVRLGNIGRKLIGYVPVENIIDNAEAFMPEYVQAITALNETPVNDRLVRDLLTTKKLVNAILHDAPVAQPKIFIAFTEPISESANFMHELPCAMELKQKCVGLDEDAVKSLVFHGTVYDKILNALKDKNLNVSRDPKLGPIADFRNEYLNNPQFRKEINALCKLFERGKMLYDSPNKNRHAEAILYSPNVLKKPLEARFSTEMRQDTPIRKEKCGSEHLITNITLHECGFPDNVKYSKDPVFAQIVYSDKLQQAFHNANCGGASDSIVICNSLPLSLDYQSEIGLSPNTKQQIYEIGLDTKMLKSVLVNGPYYERLFQTLYGKGISYENCKLLQPIKQMRQLLRMNPPLLEELQEYVLNNPNCNELSYDIKLPINSCRRIDTGFSSLPSTPNHNQVSNDELKAEIGKYSIVPGIEDMLMYPKCADSLSNDFKQLSINYDTGISTDVELQKCRDCKQPIQLSEVVVKAERAGKETAWHPNCFKCFTCGELLADLVYFFHQGQVYCGRDLAIKLKIPRCRACDELIFTKEYTAAEGATFHIKHFCCYHCDTPLAGQQYIPDEKTNMPLCLKCYDEYFAASCQRCHLPIGPSDQGVAWGEIHWHGACFNCCGMQCSKSLIGGKFCVKQNMPFCSPACVRSVMK